jgi:hypothetical protein
MAYQCPYTPLELHALNPHCFDYGDRVVLPSMLILGPIGKGYWQS